MPHSFSVLTHEAKADRVADRLAYDGNCLLWLGAVSGNGYGVLSVDGRDRLAHRVFFAWLHEPIPEGLQLDHLCRLRNCVAPWHLEPVTAQENTQRARSVAAGDRCPSGHLRETNAYRTPKGALNCRSCNHERYLRRTPKGLT